MRKAERESFLKSFGVFFFSLALLSGILGYLEFFKLKHEMQEKVYNEMRLCSYDLQCTQYEFDFLPLKAKELYQLNESPKELYALFSIPKNDTYALKIALPQHHYQKLLTDAKQQVLEHYLWALLIILIISTLFSLYALSPLRGALHLTEEFSRDILHDLNTPLSALRLNVSLLEKTPKDTKKIERMVQSIDTIVSLGDNLRSYLEEHEYQREEFDLNTLVRHRVDTFEKLYSDLNFITNNETFLISTHRDAMIRILDNLISNAAKYNRRDGSVTIIINAAKSALYIQDSGKGIQNPDKIFDRYYKEHERGIGIGLHIVKKFCDELKIPIHVESRIGKGSIFTLDLRALTLH